METSFCELRGKEVINIVDGRKLGKIIDMVFDTKCARILGIVVPGYNKSWNIFKSNDDIFIPTNCICKFGEDAILVQIYLPNQKENFAKKGRFVQTAVQSTEANDYAEFAKISGLEYSGSQETKPNTDKTTNTSQ